MRRRARFGSTTSNYRPIDGVDQSDFLLGKQQNSNREGFVVYMGDKGFGVKWRNWKLHFEELENWSGMTQTPEMPRLYDLHNDPGETVNVLFPHTWVPKKPLPLLTEHVMSLRQNPPIRMGQPDPYVPPGE